MTNRGLLRLLTVLLAALMSVGVAAAPGAVADDPNEAHWHSDKGPPDPIPSGWMKENQIDETSVGIDKNNKYCILGQATGCDLLKKPDIHDSCEEHQVGCDDPKITEERKKRELAKLADWEKATDHGAFGYQKMDAAVRKCIEGGQLFDDCRQLNAQLMVPDGGPVAWIEGKISKLASDALKEAAGTIGEGVVWLLQQFADSFNDASTIDLSKVGIDHVTGIMTTLSLLVAMFLALVQFGKVAVSQQGAPLATVLKGLGKYALVLGVYAGAAQVVLNWIDQVSIWIINLSFKDGGSTGADAATAMKTQLGTLFSGLLASGGTSTALISGGGVMSQAIGVIIVLGILSILVIGALWIEMFLRQAGIMVLMAAMPIALAGQLSEETQDWWPKARRAFTAIAFSKLAIVVCFAIGFNSMGQSQGVKNVIVGLIVFLLAAFAWPVLARFLTMVEAGGGNSVAAGMISSVGSSVGAMFGGFAGGSLATAGAGAVGGGSGYTKALEQETSPAAPDGASGEVTPIGAGAGRRFWKGDPNRSFKSKLGGALGTGLQLAAAGASTLEGAAANTAANAGLGAPGHGHATVIPPRNGGGAVKAAEQKGKAQAGGSAAEPEGPNAGSQEADVPTTVVPGGPVSGGSAPGHAPQTGGTATPAFGTPVTPVDSDASTLAFGTPVPSGTADTATPAFGTPVPREAAVAVPPRPGLPPRAVPPSPAMPSRPVQPTTPAQPVAPTNPPVTPTAPPTPPPTTPPSPPPPPPTPEGS